MIKLNTRSITDPQSLECSAKTQAQKKYIAKIADGNSTQKDELKTQEVTLLHLRINDNCIFLGRCSDKYISLSEVRERHLADDFIVMPPLSLHFAIPAHTTHQPNSISSTLTRVQKFLLSCFSIPPHAQCVLLFNHYCYTPCIACLELTISIPQRLL